ncbi:MAG: hypothetical protein IJW77_10250 [Clostridia bacterium]|nr:hypothetical protein [Clostridia bacterium]
MKRNIALILAAVLAASMISCGGNDTTDTTDTTGAGTESAVVTEEVIEANTVATKLQVAFIDAVKANPAATAEEIAGTLAQNEAVAVIGPAVAPMVEGWLNGFDAESITGFSECAMFAPMIGTIPFMGYVFTLADGADVEAFKTQLTSSANLRWNICTEAEEMVCDDEGNKVFFVMAPKAFEE